jgi:hypothetical protein
MLTPDQLLIGGTAALALAMFVRRMQVPQGEAVPPPFGKRGPVTNLLYPMRDPLPVGNARVDFYEKHMALRAMSGGFKTTLMAQLLRERLKAGRSCVVLTGGDSDQLETEVRAHGGWIVRPNKSPLKFNAFEGTPSFMAQGWAGLFPTNTEAKVFHSAFEIAAIRYFQTHSRYSVRGLMDFMLSYDPDKDPATALQLESGERVPKLDGRLWKGMREGYVGIRLQLMDIAFGNWIGDQLSVLECARRGVPIMFVVDSADDPDLNRFAAALVWQAINYAIRERGDIDVFVDELGRLPVNLVGDHVRTWRRNKSHLIVGSHKDSDFSEILEDLIHVQLLGTMVASATKTRAGASEKTWGLVHPTAFGAHAMQPKYTIIHQLLKAPRKGAFYMVDLERVQRVVVSEYCPPKTVKPRWSMNRYLNATGKTPLRSQDTSPASLKDGLNIHAGPVPVSPVVGFGVLGTDPNHQTQDVVREGPPEAPAWVHINEHTRSLWERVYFPHGALHARACWHIRLALKGKGKRPGFQYRVGGDWLMYDFVKCVEHALSQGFTDDELVAFLQYSKLKFKAGELSVDHVCEEWAGVEAKLCVRGEHLEWETRPANTDLHWERWWAARNQNAEASAVG